MAAEDGTSSFILMFLIACLCICICTAALVLLNPDFKSMISRFDFSRLWPSLHQRCVPIASALLGTGKAENQEESSELQRGENTTPLQNQKRAQPDLSQNEDCVMRAAILSTYVYEDCREHVAKYCDKLGVHFESFYVPKGKTPNGEEIHKTIVAMDRRKDRESTLYMCFGDTEGIAYFVTDAGRDFKDLRHKELSACDDSIKGLLHRAEEKVPSMNVINHILTDDTAYKADRIIFCGHSLGGALAQKALILYKLVSTAHSKCKNAQAIVFGAPHICNELTRNYLDGHAESLINYVEDEDPVPHLLNYIPNSWVDVCKQIIHLRAEAKKSYIRASITRLWAFLRRDDNLNHKIAREVYSTIASLERLELKLGTGKGKNHAQCGEYLRAILTAVGKLRASDDQGGANLYVPIGKYRSLAHEEIAPSKIGTERLETTVKEGALQHHHMSNYLCKLETFPKPNSPDLPTSFEPSIIEFAPSITKASLELSGSRKEEIDVTCIVTGEDLDFPILGELCLTLKTEKGVTKSSTPVPACWTVTPDSSSSRFSFTAKLPVATANKYLNPESTLEVYVVTSFGKMTKDVDKLDISGLEHSRIWWNSPLTRTYNRSIHRIALAFASCSNARLNGPFHDAWDVLNRNPQLQLKQLGDLLGSHSFLETFPYVQNETRRLREEMEKGIFLHQIESRSLLTLLAKGFKDHKVGGNLLLLHAAKFLEAHNENASRQEKFLEVDEEGSEWEERFPAMMDDIYKLTSRFNLENLEDESGLKPSFTYFGKMYLNFRFGFNADGYTESPDKKYLYSEQNRKDFIARLQLLKTICSAAEEVQSTKVVAVVGCENSGKSTLIDGILRKVNSKDIDANDPLGLKDHTMKVKAKGIDADDPLGFIDHTVKVKGYMLPENRTLVLDTPGTGAPKERFDLGKAFQKLQDVPDLCVAVSRFSGDVKDEDERFPKWLVDNVCENVILVVNQVDSVLKGPCFGGEDCVWNQFNEEWVTGLKGKYAKATGVPKEHVFMTVLGKNKVYEQEKSLLEERGVLLEGDAVEKILDAINRSKPGRQEDPKKKLNRAVRLPQQMWHKIADASVPRFLTAPIVEKLSMA